MRASAAAGGDPASAAAPTPPSRRRGGSIARAATGRPAMASKVAADDAGRQRRESY